jgi:Na+:H+ antiporter, NhaC family
MADSTQKSTTTGSEPTMDEAATQGPRTPSMFASWMVIVVMIALILTSVALFGGDMADGALQVSMTLATIFALAVAYYYGHRGSVISNAIHSGVNGAVGTVFVVIAIGTVIGTLYLSGTVAAFIYYGSDIISPRFFFLTVFLIASVLTIMLGSSLTTVGAVGIAFVGLASIADVSQPITAGAAVSGAVLGNKIAKISDTANLAVSTVGGDLTIDVHSKTVTRTAIPAAVVCAVLYLLLGLFGDSGSGSIDVDQVQSTISQAFNVSLWAFIPVISIFALSMLRFSAFLSLTLSAIVAVVIAAFTQNDLIRSLADNPDLSYFEAVIEVGIDTFANGFALNSGVDQLDSLFAGGGVASMLTTVWLILVAAAFGAVVGSTGMLHRIITPIIAKCSGPTSLVLTTMLSSIGLNLATADPYTSIVLTGNMYRDEYKQQRLKPQLLSASMADSGTVMSHIIPWNLHGAIFAGTLGIATVKWGPWTFFAYVTPVVTFLMVRFYFLHKDRLPTDADAEQAYAAEPAAPTAPQGLA